MPLKELRELPVSELAADDCALFLWALASMLPVAIALGETWGFRYKSVAFVWDKGRIGLGYWTRQEAEVCLLFTKGRPRRKSRAVRQVIRAPRREHSRKPDETYAGIEALVAGPYLELFARTRRRGWESWGDEADTFISH